MDTTTTRLWRSQVAHILPSASDSSSDAQGREDSASLGLEYWQTCEARKGPVSVNLELLMGML